MCIHMHSSVGSERGELFLKLAPGRESRVAKKATLIARESGVSLLHTYYIYIYINKRVNRHINI